MRFLVKLVLILAAIVLVGIFVIKPVLCQDTILHTSGTQAMERRVESFLQQRVASQRDIDSIDGVPNLERSLEDVLEPPSPQGDNVVTKAAGYVMALWHWVRSIPDKFRTVWNWDDAQSAEYRDRLFVSAASASGDREWNRAQYLNIVQSAAILDCAAHPNTCHGENWYIERSTSSWRSAVNQQINELCPDGIMRQVMCGAGTCGFHATAAKGRSLRAATQVYSVERLHATLHWFADRITDVKNNIAKLNDGIPEWVKHPIRTMQEHYDGQGEIERR